MKKGLWHRRIPTLAAFAILLSSLWVTSFLIQKGVIFVGRASPDKTPQNIRISNVTDSSFTVSFSSSSQTTAGVSVGKLGEESFLVLDDRNKKSGDQKAFYSHYITIADLIPNTVYEFSILSDGETYLNQGNKYSVKTGSRISSTPPSQLPIFGKVILPDGAPAGDTIAEVDIPGSQKISALTRDNGEYLIPSNSIRSSDLSSYSTLTPDQPVSITLLRGEKRSTIKTLFKNTKTIPAATLGYKYDFTNGSKQEEIVAVSQLSVPTEIIKQGEVRITNPRLGQSFVDTRPLFKGTGLPNQTVKITIESDPITASVRTDAGGSWSYRPDVPLSAGQHKITIETLDKSGTSKTLTVNFSVFPSGSQVEESATPSATPTTNLTPTKTPTPTAVPSVSPTISPSLSPTEIPSVTVSPTITASPTGEPTATLAPTVIPSTVTLPPASPTNPPVVTPVSPGSSTSLVLTAVSVLLIFAGSALLFLL